jgi:hypothetical protein
MFRITFIIKRWAVSPRRWVLFVGGFVLNPGELNVRLLAEKVGLVKVPLQVRWVPSHPAWRFFRLWMKEAASRYGG